MGTLSDKRSDGLIGTKFYVEEDVKEFIQTFKNRMHDFELENNVRLFDLYGELNELAGDALVSEGEQDG